MSDEGTPRVNKEMFNAVKLLDEPDEWVVQLDFARRLERRARRNAKTAWGWRREARKYKAEILAYLCAWEEFARWPGLPQVPFGAIVTNPMTGESKPYALRAEQITGLTRAAEKHIRSLMPDGVAMMERLHRQESECVLRGADLARLRAENERLRGALELISAIEGRKTHLGMVRLSGIEQGCLYCISELALGRGMDAECVKASDFITATAALADHPGEGK